MILIAYNVVIKIENHAIAFIRFIDNLCALHARNNLSLNYYKLFIYHYFINSLRQY